jgi:hypothetical protein
MIRDINQDSDIRALSGETYKKANELWYALKEVHGFGPTRVSKLLAASDQICYRLEIQLSTRNSVLRGTPGGPLFQKQ